MRAPADTMLAPAESSPGCSPPLACCSVPDASLAHPLLRWHSTNAAGVPAKLPYPDKDTCAPPRLLTSLRVWPWSSSCSWCAAEARLRQ